MKKYFGEGVAASDAGILLLRRTDWHEFGKRLPVIGLNQNEVISRYRGIEGDLWPDESSAQFSATDTGLAPIAAASEILRFAARLCELSPDKQYDVILVDPSLSANNSAPIGYECGYLEGDQNVFSAILNDIIYGRFPALINFRTALNEHLLFNSLDAAKSFLQCRDELIQAGYDLEADDTFRMFSISEVSKVKGSVL